MIWYFISPPQPEVSITEIYFRWQLILHLIIHIVMKIITARVLRREVMFSLCLPPGGGSTLSPSHNTSTGPISFLRGTQSPSHNTSTGPMSFLGVPQWLAPGPFLGGYPSPGQEIPQFQVGGGYPMRGSAWGTPARSAWGTPQLGVPPQLVWGTPLG